MQPNFLILGPPKCASSSLHFYLSQHPEVFMSKVKETNFFTRDYEKGIEFYKSYFSQATKEKAIGESTPSYSFLPFAADRIQKHYPDMKLILCFRNPVERAFSNWLMLWDAGVEKATFREALEINLKQMEYVSFDGEQGANIWNNRVHNIDKGEKWVRMYIQAGMYSEILKVYFQRFKRENIKYIFMEDFKSDFDASIQSIYRFIGVDDSFQVPVKEEQNYYYNRKLYRSLNRIIGIKSVRFISGVLPKEFRNSLKQKKNKVKKTITISSQDKSFAAHIYRNEIEELEKLLNKNLDHWK